MAADADISIPCRSSTVVTEALCHTGIGFTIPDLHVDVQRRNFQCANAAILALHVLCAGIGRLTIHRGGRSAAGNSGTARVSGVHTVTANPGGHIHKLLQSGQTRLFHNAGLRSAKAAIRQFGNLVVHKIGAAVVVR